MRKFLLLTGIICASVFIQAQDLAELRETARVFTRDGDYSNAILVLNRARQMQPDNLGVLQDLAFNYFLLNDLKNAVDIVRPLVDRKDAEVQTFQVAGSIWKAQGDIKELDKLYKKGLKKFPESGVLYNEYGEILFAKADYDAIKYWEKGIEVEPNFPGNYYNAAKFYYFTTDKVWSLIYGEIFVNLESYSQRTAEIKSILLEGYKKLFLTANLLEGYSDKNPFALAFLSAMNQQSSLAMSGLNIDKLIMIRTRFILDWFHQHAQKFPFRLFEYHRQLLKEGMFLAYNQWIFGAAENLAAYQLWTRVNETEHERFTNFQRGRVFKLADNQYYKSASR